MTIKTKKVILFIVEGPTDEDTLSPVLKKIFQNEDVRFHVVHGDMTSNWSISGGNAVKTVYEHIEIERKRYGFDKKDIMKVIHLVDTDGVFIPADKIIYREAEGIQYYDDRIESMAPENIVSRNARKSQVLRRLYLTNKVGSFPYRIYYFSRNLEHVFHNVNRTLTVEEKVNYADAFADRYDSDLQGFITFITTSNFTVPGEFMDSWDLITQGLNSLNRYSNFHLLFQNNE